MYPVFDACLFANWHSKTKLARLCIRDLTVTPFRCCTVDVAETVLLFYELACSASQ